MYRSKADKTHLLGWCGLVLYELIQESASERERLPILTSER